MFAMISNPLISRKVFLYFVSKKKSFYTLKQIHMTAHNPPSLFEQIKKSDEEGNEFWSARELAKVLEYTEYRHFKPAIERAKESCKNSEWSVSDHFEDMHDMIEVEKGLHDT